MKGDFVESLMKEVAQELGKPYATMAAFETKLRDNWVDSKDAFLMLDEKSLSQMGFPIILQKKLLEKIELHKGGSADVRPNVSEQIVSDLLNDLYKQVFGSSNLITTLKTLHKILGNLVHSPEEQKFKRINLENQTITEKVAKYPPAVGLLELAGFVLAKNNSLEVSTVTPQLLANFKFVIKLIEEFGNKVAGLINNQGKASFHSTAGKTNSDLAHMNNSDIGAIHDKLRQLKEHRQSLLPSTVPRKTTIIDQSQVTRERMNLIASNRFYQAQEEPQTSAMDEEPEQKNIFSQEQLKEIIKNLTEGPSFSNRTKKEFEQLASTPVFTETILRIEMPNGKILQSHFSPSEKVADVRREVEKHFKEHARKWFLYTAPPLQKLELKRLKDHSLEMLDLVPRANIKIGFEDNN